MVAPTGEEREMRLTIKYENNALDEKIGGLLFICNKKGTNITIIYHFKKI
jgi:hypothetical protein